MEERTFQLLINSTEKLKAFCSLLALYPNAADMLADRYVVDARSVIGVLSLDLTRPVTMRLYGPADEALIAALKAFEI